MIPASNLDDHQEFEQKLSSRGQWKLEALWGSQQARNGTSPSCNERRWVRIIWCAPGARHGGGQSACTLTIHEESSKREGDGKMNEKRRLTAGHRELEGLSACVWVHGR